jgi:hypothetical protein
MCGSHDVVEAYNGGVVGARGGVDYPIASILRDISVVPLRSLCNSVTGRQGERRDDRGG